MKHRSAAVAAPFLVLAATAQVQPGFDAVSVRPSVFQPAAAARGEPGNGGGCPTSMKIDQGRVDMRMRSRTCRRSDSTAPSKTERLTT
jgi:hypothetical protein